MHIALDKLLGRQMHRIHQFPQHLYILILQVDKITIFEPVIFRVLLISFQYLQQVFPADILCVNLQLQQAARHRHAYRHPHLSHNIKILKRCRALHVPHLSETFHTAV